jgi:hypothetical protein
MEPCCQKQPCNLPPVAHGLCRRHYEQARRRRAGITIRVPVSAETLDRLEAEGDPVAVAAAVLERVEF